LLEVEGVELSEFSFNLSKVVFSSSLSLDKKIKIKQKKLMRFYTMAPFRLAFQKSNAC
jgi:hypothetical protein